MNLNELAALIEIRNYSVAARELKNVYKGQDYKDINSKIVEIDTFLRDEILSLDLNALIDDGPDDHPDDGSEKFILAGTPKTIAVTVTHADVSPDSNSSAVITVTHPDDKTLKNKDIVEKNDVDVLGDDAELILKRIAEEKAKLGDKGKSTKKVVKK